MLTSKYIIKSKNNTFIKNYAIHSGRLPSFTTKNIIKQEVKSPISHLNFLFFSFFFFFFWDGDE